MEITISRFAGAVSVEGDLNREGLVLLLQRVPLQEVGLGEAQLLLAAQIRLAPSGQGHI